MRKVERLTYFEFHPADYLLDTGDLDMQQHGAYAVLMFRYYWDGELLKANVYRDCRKEGDREAIDFVLARYFHPDGERYVHNRIERELEAIKGYIEHQSRAGTASGEARRGKKRKPREPKINGVAHGFAEFYASYPRRLNRAEAEKAWIKLSPDEALRTTIMAAVAAQKNSVQWRKDNGAFIPHPASWLNARRWEDEAVQPIKEAFHL